MTYKRVVPRDIFNEASLLKLLGRLAIYALTIPGKKIHFEHDGGPFLISQDPNDGSLRCENVRFFIDSKPLDIFRPLNSREDWCLYASLNGDEALVFSSGGYTTFEFERLGQSLIDDPEGRN